MTLSPLMCGKRDPPVAVVTHAGHSAKPSLGVTYTVKSQVKPGLNKIATTTNTLGCKQWEAHTIISQLINIK